MSRTQKCYWNLVWPIAIGLAVVLVGSVSQAETMTISSSPFSLGYGIVEGDIWNTSETSGSNTATNIGDFGFAPTMTAGSVSGTGPTFGNRTLGDGDDSTRSGDSRVFGVSIAGSWAGDTPADAAADPDYHVQVNISSLRIWAVTHPNWQANDIAFTETTSGHTATSPYLTGLTVVSVPGMALADNYKQLTWDPADYYTSGIDFTREFALLVDAGLAAIDGFEVFGTVDLTYTVIPEPSTVMLLAMGVLMFGLLLWRRRR